MRGFSGLEITESIKLESGGCTDNLQTGIGSSQPPPPPVPPPKPSGFRRLVSGTSDSSLQIGPSKRPGAWPVPVRTSPSGSRPSSPRSHCDGEGYNSTDEQNPCFGSTFYDLERERQFEIDIRRTKGLEVKRMLGNGNCLFREVADQVYGDSEAYDLVRQMCIDYMMGFLCSAGLLNIDSIGVSRYFNCLYHRNCLFYLEQLLGVLLLMSESLNRKREFLR